MYPTIFDFGTLPGPIPLPIAIHSYGLMMALAFLTSMFITQRELTRRELDPQFASSVVLWIAVGGVIGAKLYSVVWTGDLSSLFANTGFVWYGGLMGGILGAAIAIHRSSNPFWVSFDVILPIGLLGYGIGRVGCFLSGDGDYGPPSDLPWAVTFPNGTVSTLAAKNAQLVNLWQRKFPDVPVPTDIPVHPTPLYEVGMVLIAFSLLWSLRTRTEGIPGCLAGVTFILGGIERFLAEFWRNSPRVLFGWFTTAQIISILLIIIGGIVIYWATHREPVPVEAEPPRPPTAPPRRRRKRRR